MAANPEYLSEHEVPIGAVIRIPFPFQSVLNEISQKSQQTFSF
jgi:hypothetical protein